MKMTNEIQCFLRELYRAGHFQVFCLLFSGTVRNLGPDLWKLQHLTSLYLNLNNITRIPPEINRLTMLTYLDLSSNKLRSLPSELGDLSQLRELLLNYNLIRMLPFELGKLFHLQTLGNCQKHEFFLTQLVLKISKIDGLLSLHLCILDIYNPM